MHDEPIAHLYTNKKMRVRVSTSNNKKFMCTVRRDNTVHELGEAVLERYNSLISDPMHRYYKQGFTATRISNIRQRSFYLSRTDYIGDLLNDGDEVECDVAEVGKKRLKKAIKQEKYTRIFTVPEVPDESPGEVEADIKLKPTNKKKKQYKKKKAGKDKGKEDFSKFKDSEQASLEPEMKKPKQDQQKIAVEPVKSNMLVVPQIKINQQTSIQPIPSPKPSPKPSPLKQEVKEHHFKSSVSNKSVQQHQPHEKARLQAHPEQKPKFIPQNSQHMRSSQKSIGSTDQNHFKLKNHDGGSFKYPPKTDRSNPKTPQVHPIRSPNVKPSTLKRNEMETLNLDSRKPEQPVSGEKHSSSRKQSQIQVVESDEQVQEKPIQKIVHLAPKKEKKQLFKTGLNKPPDHSHIFSSFLKQQDLNSD